MGGAAQMAIASVIRTAVVKRKPVRTENSVVLVATGLT